MKDKSLLLILILYLIPLIVLSQSLPKDSLYGNVKRIREKVIFLTEIENPQLFYKTDYGHTGFMGPESTIERFYKTWYCTNFCYYLNYERCFDKKRNIIKDTWFGKKDDFMKSYKYVYDKKERLISISDSTGRYVDTKNHYFKENGGIVEESIIHENLRLNIFSHVYNKYKNGKIIQTKSFDGNGIVNEKINHYNEFDELEYTIYKNPNSWKKLDENSWSYGIHDSIGVTYKSLINEFDNNNKLIKTQLFDLYSDQEHKKPVQTTQTVYVYKGNNVVTEIRNSKGYGQLTYINCRYDKNNRLIENYCCDENISNSKYSKKYTYKGDKIIKLIFSEESFKTKKMMNYHVSFTYKYDKKNNWIEIVKAVDGVNLYKWIREIEYYE